MEADEEAVKVLLFILSTSRTLATLRSWPRDANTFRRGHCVKFDLDVAEPN